MKITKSSYDILTDFNGIEVLQDIEEIGRVAYKSENKATDDSYLDFIRKIVKLGHLSVLEHFSISVRIVCDRGISHEIVRHRIASYTQESTRYCNYNNDKFGNQITVILPSGLDEKQEVFDVWIKAMEDAEQAYLKLTGMGVSPQWARSVLPNSLKTEIVVTMNLREWRHFFELRTAKTAHPQMREIACPLAMDFKRRIPIVFDDIKIEE